MESLMFNIRINSPMAMVLEEKSIKKKYLFIVVIEVNHIIYIEGERSRKQKPNFRVKIPKVYIHTTIQHNLWGK